MSRAETLNNENLWINPIGGFGDILMLSGVLKLVVDRDPSRKFNLVRRTKYLTFLKDHPAIDKIGFPPKGAQIVGTDYWAKESLGGGNQRAFQVLARIFALETPVPENLYVPPNDEQEDLLKSLIPWGDKNVLIAPASDSPRKMMAPQLWHQLVSMLKAEGFFVIQAGRLGDIHIRNAYSILGLTTHCQLISLLKKVDVIITSDNFIMHAAHLLKSPAVVLWGATRPEVYGYSEQVHLSGNRLCELGQNDDCLTGSVNREKNLYPTPCPQKDAHCMNRIDLMEVLSAVKRL